MEIDNKYLNYKDSYTYRQILIGLRNEFLEYQKKLDMLSDYVFMFEDQTWLSYEKRDEYHFDLYKKTYTKDAMPELALNRVILRKRLLEKLRLNSSPTRSFMVKDNNGIYYPLRKHWFEKYQFNMVVKPLFEKEFQECVEEILNSDFAKYMQLNEHIYSATSNIIDQKNNSFLKPNLTSYGFDLLTNKSEFKYLGRYDMLEFSMSGYPKERWEPLTQEHLDYISDIQFPKDAFSEYHQSIIERSIDDERPIILSDQYQPTIHTKLEIKDDSKKLILVKSNNNRYR